MAEYKVIVALGEGSSIGAQEEGAVVEINEPEVAEALVVSGHIEAVA